LSTFYNLIEYILYYGNSIDGLDEVEAPLISINILRSSEIQLHC